MTEIRIPKSDDIQIEPVEGHQLADLDLATRAVRVLTEHYPYYLWRVWIQAEDLGGVMHVINMDVCAALFGGKLWGYTLHLSMVYHDPGLKCVVMAGWEILERANLIRGRANVAEPIRVDGVPEKYQPIKGVTIQ